MGLKQDETPKQQSSDTAVVRNLEPYHKSDDKSVVLNGGGSIFPVTAVAILCGQRNSLVQRANRWPFRLREESRCSLPSLDEFFLVNKVPVVGGSQV
jgi:hypothetical protein